ncbi:DNA cytosine methyltransferase [Mesoterricola silvestris]|uniref:DNA (cytosine-5-)-methyltransferase n=1 Tax=Mesoterricola silvestris TaxID=2927979 RepID=A0AA48GJL2_9BACT|nr:hypothetical protein METEAL_15280 [Mesoterricola silvestris]
MNVPLRELHLFAGAGGGILGGILCGHVCVGAVELEEYPRSVLLQRQRDGILPWFPVWNDVCTFDGTPWRGHVDVIAGGFPCQDISAAGKGAGVAGGGRSGLWREFARIIREVGPRYVFVENSPMLTLRGLDIVLGDLAELGFHAAWGVLGAHHAGAIHQRDRIWLLGRNAYHPESAPIRIPPRREIARPWGIGSDGSHCTGIHVEEPQMVGSEEPYGESRGTAIHVPESFLGTPWEICQPPMVGMADGMADYVGRVKAIGNGQVPAVACLAWRTLMHRLG